MVGDLYEISFSGDWDGVTPSSWTLANVTYYDADGNITTLTSLATHYRIREGVTKIGSYAFRNCSELIRIVIPEGITIIGEWAFNGCHVQSIIFPQTLLEFGPYCLYSCRLYEINIPENVTTIRESALAWTRNVKSIYIPKSVTTVGKRFLSDGGATSIIIDARIEVLPDDSFATSFEPVDIVLPDSIITIGANVFSGTTIKSLKVTPYTHEAALKLKRVFGESYAEEAKKIQPKVLFTYGKLATDIKTIGKDSQKLYYKGAQIWERLEKEPWEAYGELGEYIQNVDTNSYIDTGVIINPSRTGTKSILKVRNESPSSVGVWGGREQSGFTAGNVFYIAPNLRMDVTGASQKTLEIQRGVFYTIEHNPIQKFVRRDNYTIDYQDLLIDRELNASYLLFTIDNNGVVFSRSLLDIKEHIITFNEEIIRSYRPLNLTKQPITDANGRVHNIGDWVMYDLATNTVPAHYGTFTGATAAQVLASQQQALQSLGVEFTNDIDTNQQQLNSLGVKI